MKFKRFTAAAIAAIMAGTTLVSCSQPNLENLLPFNEDKSAKYTSVVENSALTIYVDANAKDGGDGSETAPFKTIPEAQAKIRELKAGEGLPVGGVTVLVKDGEYRLDSGLVFTEEDSGTAESPITYVSESEFGAIITGGLILSADDFEPLNDEEKSRLMDETAKEKVVKVDLKKYNITETDWGKLYNIGTSIIDDSKKMLDVEIFVNDVRLHSARYPNEEFLRTVKVVDNGDSYYVWESDMFEAGSVAIYDYNSYTSNPNPRPGAFSIESNVAERISQWSTIEDVCLFIYPKFGWSYRTQFVKDIDIENAIIYNSESSYHGLSRNAPFYLYNIFDELDNQYEYFIDSNNAILYLYTSNLFDSAEIIMSCSTDSIVVAENTSYLTFKGFGACATFGNGFDINGDFVNIDHCKIYNIKGSGIVISGYNNNVKNCEIAHMGACGVTVTGGDPVILEKGNNLVYNNCIHDFSQVERVYTPAVSLYGCGNTASCNEIYNSPHEAITWNGPYQTIEYNEIYNVCTETSDCGAIYAGANQTSYGCVQRYNYIHDIGMDDASAHGIYWDDGLSGQTAYGNIIVNASGRGFLIGGGRDNVIENNIIINPGSDPLMYDQRTSQEMNDPEGAWFTYTASMAEALVSMRNDVWIKAFPIYGQIIPWYEGYEGDLNEPLLSGNPANNLIKNNITYYYNETKLSQSISFYGFDKDVRKFSEIEKNFILCSYLADFPGWHNEDYTMSENSKAKELCPDFEPIPFDKIGRID